MPQNSLECPPEKQFLPARCLGRTRAGDGIVSFAFDWAGPAPKAGQFFLVKPARTSVFLGRPLCAASWQPGQNGPGTLGFLVALRGKGTTELATLAAGETAFLTGPLGKGWADACGQAGPFSGALALVSGGVGVAPLACFARESGGAVVDFYAGYKSASFGLDGLSPRKLVISSEDGSEGLKGRIPDFLVPEQYAAVFVCGPEPMMKAVAAKCRAANVPCFISLERRMACGVGACLGCTVKTRNGNRRCCADGPVFHAEEIFFDE